MVGRTYDVHCQKNLTKTGYKTQKSKMVGVFVAMNRVCWYK